MLKPEQEHILRTQVQVRTLAEAELRLAQARLENAQLRVDIAIRDICQELQLDPKKVQFHFREDGSVSYTINEAPQTTEAVCS